MLRNSPTALRVLKSALNAAEDGQAGIQVGLQVPSGIARNSALSAAEDSQGGIKQMWILVASRCTKQMWILVASRCTKQMWILVASSIPSRFGFWLHHAFLQACLAPQTWLPIQGKQGQSTQQLMPQAGIQVGLLVPSGVARACVLWQPAHDLCEDRLWLSCV